VVEIINIFVLQISTSSFISPSDDFHMFYKVKNFSLFKVSGLVWIANVSSRRSVDWPATVVSANGPINPQPEVQGGKSVDFRIAWQERLRRRIWSWGVGVGVGGGGGWWHSIHPEVGS
jgi:hypothetical protein